MAKNYNDSSDQLLKTIEEAVYRLLTVSTSTVPHDVLEKLELASIEEQSNPLIDAQLSLMLENIKYGTEKTLPICQDTGTPNFFLQLGSEFPIIDDFHSLFLEILEKLTTEGAIRPNTVDPFTQKNPKTNGGKNMPPIYLEIIPDREDLVITVLNKGGGAENISALFMLTGSTGLQVMKSRIVETIKNAGGMPCPPVILGIGIGGDAVKAMYLAKRALLRPLGIRNIRKEAAELEEELIKLVNQSDVGVMGLGGKTTCLDVRIEWAMRHPASFPVGLIVQCYSHRTRSCRITPPDLVEFGNLDSQYHFEKGEI